MLTDDISHLLSLNSSCLNMAGVDKALHLFQDCHTMEGLFHESPCRITQNVPKLVHVDFLPCCQLTVCNAQELRCHFICTNFQRVALRATLV
jgi:hypothetical protein